MPPINIRTADQRRARGSPPEIFDAHCGCANRQRYVLWPMVTSPVCKGTYALQLICLVQRFPSNLRIFRSYNEAIEGTGAGTPLICGSRACKACPVGPKGTLTAKVVSQVRPHQETNGGAADCGTWSNLRDFPRCQEPVSASVERESNSIVASNNNDCPGFLVVSIRGKTASSFHSCKQPNGSASPRDRISRVGQKWSRPEGEGRDERATRPPYDAVPPPTPCHPLCHPTRAPHTLNNHHPCHRKPFLALTTSRRAVSIQRLIH